MTQDQAEIIALNAITFILSDDQVMNAFMAQTGMGLDDMKQAATNPEGLAGILDFLLQWEDAMLAFCEAEKLSPEDPAKARQALPGFMGWG